MMRLACVALLGLAACGSAPIGQPPAFSEMGRALDPALPRVNPSTLAYPVPAPEAMPSYADASLWRSGPQSLFGDRRARGQGDILTVVIEIDEQAEFTNSTNRTRSGAEEIGIGALAGLEQSADRLLPNGAGLDPAVSTNSSTNTAGNGATRRGERVTLRVAATVVAVLPNGHLVVQGSQEVRVNFDLRDLQIAGVVRPEDISRRNEITYDKIADARIAYGGRGQIMDLQQPRYGQQIIERVMPF